MNWNASWALCPRTSQKLRLSQLPNQHGTTWAGTSTAQWADCFWECEYPEPIQYKCCSRPINKPPNRPTANYVFRPLLKFIKQLRNKKGTEHESLFLLGKILRNRYKTRRTLVLGSFFICLLLLVCVLVRREITKKYSRHLDTLEVPLHSEKFKMNRNGNSILSENICDLLLVWNVFSFLLHYKRSGLWYDNHT